MFRTEPDEDGASWTADHLARLCRQAVAEGQQELRQLDPKLGRSALRGTDGIAPDLLEAREKLAAADEALLNAINAIVAAEAAVLRHTGMNEPD